MWRLHVNASSPIVSYWNKAQCLWTPDRTPFVFKTMLFRVHNGVEILCLRTTILKARVTGSNSRSHRERENYVRYEMSTGCGGAPAPSFCGQNSKVLFSVLLDWVTATDVWTVSLSLLLTESFPLISGGFLSWRASPVRRSLRANPLRLLSGAVEPEPSGK